MFVLLNNHAGGGKAKKRWEKFLGTGLLPESAAIFSGGSKSELEHKIKNVLSEGETQFVAAGGDGTLNLLLNSVYYNSSYEQLQKINFGAVGIGSSNDFHKPLMVADSPIVPHKINFNNVEERDIGCITYNNGSIGNRKLFLINASIGLTAAGNNYFNFPDKLLKVVKKLNTGSAIYLAALRTIINYKKIEAAVSTGTESFTTNLSNLGVAKNPHFAGDMRYEFSPDYDKGKFNIILFHDMTRMEHLFLLFKLAGRQNKKLRKELSWEDKRIKISSRETFWVEYDGETIKTSSAEFRVLEQKIKVCSC